MSHDAVPHATETPLPLTLNVLAQYVKDASFENPNAPESLRVNAQPEIELNVDMQARGKGEKVYEVDLHVRASATREGETLFLVEVVYAGLFLIDGVGEAEIEPVLLVECPRLLFPFARRIVADLTRDGGFPPLMLEPIDFLGLYLAQRVQSPAGMA